MMKIMRKEAGLNKDSISEPALMSFIINDITKPEMLREYYRCNLKRKMIKFVILGGKIKSNSFLYWLWYSKLKPLICIVIYIITLIIFNIFANMPKKIGRKIKGVSTPKG